MLNIWHNYREAAEAAETDADNKLPTMEELEAAAQHCDINNVIIDADAKTVYLADPEMSLDVGSVGKGYAVEMVCQAAEARGLTSALVSVGGNLRAIGVNRTAASGPAAWKTRGALRMYTLRIPCWTVPST